MATEIEKPREGIGERIEKLRKQKEVTQQEMADALGVDRVTISQWEKGTRDIKTGNMVSVAEYLGVSCDYLLGRVRAAAPDDFIQETVRRFGLSDDSLNALKELNTHHGVEDDDVARIKAKQAAKKEDLSSPHLTMDELDAARKIEQYESNQKVLAMLNVTLTKTASKRSREVYMHEIMTHIWNSCFRDYSDIEVVQHGDTGDIHHALTSIDCRKIDILKLNDVVEELCGEVREDAENGKNKR